MACRACTISALAVFHVVFMSVGARLLYMRLVALLDNDGTARGIR